MKSLNSDSMNLSKQIKEYKESRIKHDENRKIIEDTISDALINLNLEEDAEINVYDDYISINIVVPSYIKLVDLIEFINVMSVDMGRVLLDVYSTNLIVRISF